MSSRAWTAILALLLCAPPRAAAQAPAGDRKQTAALRVPDGSIRLDGRLDDEVWLRALAVTDFTQKEPTEGAAPSDPTDVRFVFDGDGLYVGARMSSASAPDIQAPLARRDSVGQAEYILVLLDTYLDRRTAAAFGVTASGVRIDRAHPRDSEDGFDSGFDPVWEAEVSRIDGGWTAELWIPFSQLRFNRENEQTWGLNISRFRPNLQEEDYWVMVPRTESVFISRFGNLRGIEGIRPTRRIELLPYVASGASIDGNRNLANPFDDGRNLTGRVGADMKLGLGPNLTLEATVNPDFGQVEADPAEVNLTAFATRFAEKRPFFLEGSQLFSINHPNFYYSRRIGARPTGPVSGDFVDYPQDATILAAAKITGRLQSKTSIGLQTAVTGAEHARIAGVGLPGTTEIPVAPRAFYGLGRQHQGGLGELRDQRHRKLERRRRDHHRLEHPLPGDAPWTDLPRLHDRLQPVERLDTQVRPPSRLPAAFGQCHLGELLDGFLVCDQEFPDPERFPDARRPADGGPGELEHVIQRREPLDLADTLVGQFHDVER